MRKLINALLVALYVLAVIAAGQSAHVRAERWIKAREAAEAKQTAEYWAKRHEESRARLRAALRGERVHPRQ